MPNQFQSPDTEAYTHDDSRRLPGAYTQALRAWLDDPTAEHARSVLRRTAYVGDLLREISDAAHCLVHKPQYARIQDLRARTSAAIGPLDLRLSHVVRGTDDVRGTVLAVCLALSSTGDGAIARPALEWIVSRHGCGITLGQIEEADATARAREDVAAQLARQEIVEKSTTGA